MTQTVCKRWEDDSPGEEPVEKEARYAWSEKNHVWQAYSGVARGSYLVVGGTAKPEESEATLRSRYAKSAAAARLKLEAPYPLVVRSDDVLGLRPGLRVLVLGRCPNRAATRPILLAAKGNRGDKGPGTIYVRAVAPDDKLLPPKCPSLHP